MRVVTDSLPPNGPGDERGSAGSVSDQWVEVYPPDGVAPEEAPEPELDPEPRHRLAPVVPGLFGGSLVLVLLGSVLPLFDANVRISFRTATSLSVTAWQFRFSDLGPDRVLESHSDPSPIPIGYPLLIAAVLLLVTVALWLRSGWRPSTGRSARVMGVVAGAFLAAFVFTLGMFEAAWRTLFGLSAIPVPAANLVGSVGQGFWLLVVAAVVAIAAIVLSFRLPTRAEPEPEPEPAPEPPAQAPQPEPPVVAVLPADDRSTW
jgi:hypothetical protein